MEVHWRIIISINMRGNFPLGDKKRKIHKKKYQINNERKYGLKKIWVPTNILLSQFDKQVAYLQYNLYTYSVYQIFLRDASF